MPGNQRAGRPGTHLQHRLGSGEGRLRLLGFGGESLGQGRGNLQALPLKLWLALNREELLPDSP